MAAVFALEAWLAVAVEPPQFAGRQTVVQLEMSPPVQPREAQQFDVALETPPEVDVPHEPNSIEPPPPRETQIAREPVVRLETADLREHLEPIADSAEPATPAAQKADGERHEPPVEPPPTAMAPRTVAQATVETPAVAAVVPQPEFLGTNEETPPDFRGNRRPDYPAEAYLRGIEGEVLLRLFISAGGRVEHVEIARSSGFPLLDRSAAEAVRTWSGVPARRGGVAIASVQTLPVVFRLRQ